ncbi:hypothetical protein NDU88_008137 [Pleurodeles waltl]|uniref:Uncharacterized protein n=1 Tax=Pleurodeles waltl TaxID=8319 RepID=A0AAV7U1V2_PLEWA|nr:hypothetical protein NDU88_008137 [Pleurodeles waltl]
MGQASSGAPRVKDWVMRKDCRGDGEAPRAEEGKHRREPRATALNTAAAAAGQDGAQLTGRVWCRPSSQAESGVTP